MQEDMNRREAELNEAELENASGGVILSPDVIHEKTRVTEIYCSPCERLGKCGHSTVENGDIRGRRNCPFYKNA